MHAHTRTSATLTVSPATASAVSGGGVRAPKPPTRAAPAHVLRYALDLAPPKHAKGKGRFTAGFGPMTRASTLATAPSRSKFLSELDGAP